MVSGGKKVLFVIINLRLDKKSNESVELLEVIVDNVEGIAANAVSYTHLTLPTNREV